MDLQKDGVTVKCRVEGYAALLKSRSIRRKNIMNRIMLGLILTMIFNTALCTPKTLRVDYYHSGNSETEMFSLDQVVLEPLAFPGNLAQPVDTTLRGKYLF